MKAPYRSTSVFFILLWCHVIFFSHAEITNKLVKKVIDISRPIVTEKCDISFVSNDKDIDTYMILFPELLQDKISKIVAACGKLNCSISKSDKVMKNGYVSYMVKFSEAVPKGVETAVKLTTTLTHVLEPLPREIDQQSSQLVVFQTSSLFMSPYYTYSQTISIILSSSSVESYSEINPVTLKGSTLSYGPYKDISAFQEPKELIRVHYKNDNPFLTLTNVIKEIELSMWGRVSVEEIYDLHHTGAKLKGGFSRLDFMGHKTKAPHIQQLFAKLPKMADNVYYRDQIGNITTSRLRRNKYSVDLELRPRFPIFGGWKTQWYLGYSLPTSDLLTRKGNQYKLKVDFSSAIDDAVIDDLSVKVILPEGASNVQVLLPFDVDSQSSTNRQTYLDTPYYGRPVSIIRKRNLVPAHNVPFEVTFEFDQTFMLHEPFLLVGAFMVLFLFAMIIFRLDVSLTSTEKDIKLKSA